MLYAYSGNYNPKEIIGHNSIGILSLNLVRHSIHLIREFTLKSRTFSQIDHDLKILHCDFFCMNATFRIKLRSNKACTMT